MWGKFSEWFDWVNTDNVDWFMFASLLVSVFSPLAEYLVQAFGKESVDMAITGMRFIAAILAVVFALLKIKVKKPFVKIIEPDEWERDNSDDCSFQFTKRLHRKGSAPMVQTYTVDEQGNVGSVGLWESVDENGLVTIGAVGSAISQGEIHKIKVIIN
ncbi:hypothetical protein N9R79_09615 [Vibrio sp.]|nr:hypothetical protein [Vibrio sp.]